MTSSVNDAPQRRPLEVILLIDEVHLSLARQVVLAGEPSLAMLFVAEEGDTAAFTVNDEPYSVEYLTRALPQDLLIASFKPSVLLAGEPLPAHGAMVVIRRGPSENVLSALLQLTEVVNTLVERIPASAILWRPFAASTPAIFKQRYKQLYSYGIYPIPVWIQLGFHVIDHKLMVMTAGLADLGLAEVEFWTSGDHLMTDMIAAEIVVARMLDSYGVFPNGDQLKIELTNMQFGVTILYRDSLRPSREAVLFLDITRFPGGRPLPGVH